MPLTRSRESTFPRSSETSDWCSTFHLTRRCLLRLECSSSLSSPRSRSSAVASDVCVSVSCISRDRQRLSTSSRAAHPSRVLLRVSMTSACHLLSRLRSRAMPRSLYRVCNLMMARSILPMSACASESSASRSLMRFCLSLDAGSRRCSVRALALSAASFLTSSSASSMLVFRALWNSSLFFVSVKISLCSRASSSWNSTRISPRISSFARCSSSPLRSTCRLQCSSSMMSSMPRVHTSASRLRMWARRVSASSSRASMSCS
mmetsp:Transcript_54750/g.173883  ORF Transcript_54750/g.173883 Transcript_54750/m.173883 type:complete len:262 (-) Transcript_54750:5709-6494(-)